MLLEKIKEWKKDIETITYYHSAIPEKKITIGMENKTTTGGLAIHYIHEELKLLKITDTIDSNFTISLSNLTKISDYLGSILIYFKSIIPYITSKEKLYLIFLEIEAINKKVVNLNPNLNKILEKDHRQMPLGQKINYEIVKTFMAYNYHMKKN